MLQAGGVGGAPAADEPAAPLEPGSVLAVPLLSGDLEMCAIGTCTEVLGDRVYGFGHAFTSEGSTKLPMGSGQINAVIANLATSFKLGAMTQARGTLCADQLVGIAGRMGKSPEMIPIELRIAYTDGSEDQTYHFNAAVHPRFTPLLSSAALAAAVTGSHQLPQYHTLDYELNLEFTNGRSVQVANTLVNANPADLFFELGTPVIAAADNPFERVMLKHVTGTVKVTPEAREAQILSVNVPREKYRPGESVKAYVTYRPFRAGEAVLPVDLDLPRDLPDGTYQLVISDWQKFFEDERAAKPFRFTAQNIDEVFAVLRDVASFRHNALYLRLLRQPDGVAVGRTAMPYLPSSRRQVLLAAGRSNTTPFVSSTVKAIPTALVMNGAAAFAITIDKDAKVEVGGRPPIKPPSKDLAPPKADEPKVKPPNPETPAAPDPEP